MTAVLADLAVESWAATVTAIRLAALVDLSLGGDRAGDGPAAAGASGRQVLGLQARRPDDRRGPGMPGRQRVCRDLPDGPAAAGVAAERHLGGLRHRHRTRRTARARQVSGVQGRLPGRTRHRDRRLRATTTGRSGISTALLSGDVDQGDARRVASLAARTLAASLLIRQAPTEIAELYCRTRLGGHGDRVFGELPAGAGIEPARDRGRGDTATTTPIDRWRQPRRRGC